MNNKKKEAYQRASKFIVLNPAWTAPSTASCHDLGHDHGSSSGHGFYLLTTEHKLSDQMIKVL